MVSPVLSTTLFVCGNFPYLVLFVCGKQYKHPLKGTVT
jgi:hypothetical protein